jgi:hypothetical protein
MKFLDMRTQSALKKNSAVRATVPYASAQHLGVLFTVEDQQKHLLIKDFIQKLTQDGKQVHVLEFLPKKKDNPEFMFDFFSAQDLNFWGKLSNDNVEKFIKINFDYLFNIDLTSHPLMQHILALSKAHCRIGKYDETAMAFYELMIETNGSVQGLLENMYTYTRKLR